MKGSGRPLPQRAVGLGDRVTDVPAGARKRVFIEVIALWLLTLLAIRAVVDLQRAAGLPDWLLAAVPLLFIYAPVLLCRLRRVDSFAYHLSIPAFSDGPAWRRAVGLCGGVLAVIIPPWLIGYHLYQGIFFQHHPGDGFHGAHHGGVAQALAAIGEPPPDFIQRMIQDATATHQDALFWLAVLQVVTLVAYQVFFVAIPEEFFYRGYLQTRLNEVFPRRFLILGTPIGWGSVFACLFFAFGHSLVQLQWWHFATFFPGMIFAWMRERSGGGVSGALFHAACNVLVVLLDTAYGIPR